MRADLEGLCLWPSEWSTYLTWLGQAMTSTWLEYILEARGELHFHFTTAGTFRRRPFETTTRETESRGVLSFLRARSVSACEGFDFASPRFASKSDPTIVQNEPSWIRMQIHHSSSAFGSSVLIKSVPIHPTLIYTKPIHNIWTPHSSLVLYFVRRVNTMGGVYSGLSLRRSEMR